MTLSFHKVLLATTAFVAVTAAANAATTVYSVGQTSSISNTGASDTVAVSGATTISVTGLPAVAVSGTGSYTLNTSASSVLTSDATSGTVSLQPDNGLTLGMTINNSGSIINTATNGFAISLTQPNVGAAAVSATINNTGTISGSIATSGTLNMTNAGTLNGNVFLGGASTVSQTGGTITGNITGGSSADTYSQTGGTLNGDVNLGAGANTINMSGGTVSGTLGLGTGTGVVNYTGGTVKDISGTGNSSVLNVSGSRVWNLTGNVVGFNTINISNTTVNLNGTQGTFTGTDHDINIGTNGSLNVTSATAGFGLFGNSNINVSGTLALTNGGYIVNDSGSTGTLNVNSGGSLFIDSGSNLNTDKLGSLGKLTIGVGTSQTTGVLNVTNGAAVLTDTSLTIALNSSAGLIANGTSYTIITGNASDASSPILTSSQAGVYSFVVSRTSGGNNVSLTINRTATSNLVSSESGKGAANVIDAVTTPTGDLKTIQNTIGNQTTAAGVDNVVNSLAPATDTGVGMASLDIGNQSNNNINARLASLRGSALTGIATGDKVSAGHMWLQGFGNVTNQDNRNGDFGYNANTAGATAGVDTDTLVDGLTTGVAFTYGASNVNSKSSNDAHTDINSYMGTLYGSKVLEDGYFLNGQLAYAYNTFDSKRNVVGFSSSTDGSWHGSQYSARAEAGRDFKYENWLLTPLASAQYTLLDQKSYTESGPAALTVNPDNLSALDLGIGAEAGYNFMTDNGGALRPRARAKFNYRAGDTQMQTTSNFVAGGTAFTTNGISADRGSVDLGAGVLLTSADGVDFSIDYDADIRSSSTGHTGQVKVKWPF
jgi:outer membrane autotransporter protein